LASAFVVAWAEFGTTASATIHASRFGLLDVAARDRYRPDASASVSAEA